MTTVEHRIFRKQSRWSHPGRWEAFLKEIPPIPDTIVRVVSGLLIHPWVAPLRGIAVPDSALKDKEIRSVAEILDVLMSRDDSPFAVPRNSSNRVICVCSGYARVATSVFRVHAIPARCRVGFAAYFTPSFFDRRRTRRVCRGKLLALHLRRRTFPAISLLMPVSPGGRARSGELDPAKMGLSTLSLAGMWFVAGSVMLDVAMLNEEGVLPWEKWSVGRGLGPGQDVPTQWLEQFDKVAAPLHGAPDEEVVHRVYRKNRWLRVTPTVASFLSGTPSEVAVPANQKYGSAGSFQ
jgi:hypothetical protein